MEDLSLARVILQNAAYIAAAFAILISLGWLWFRPGGLLGVTKNADPLARVALYPVLGWMLVVIGASWLRMLAVPFSKSAPWLLAFLTLIPLGLWISSFRRRKLKPDNRSGAL
jgi:hypothetical protein